MLIKTIIAISFLLSLNLSFLFADFNEGVDHEISQRDLPPETKEWAKNTALKLREVLTTFRNVSPQDRRAYLVKVVQDSIQEAKHTRELLLMRFTLNRTLDLDHLFDGEPDELSISYVLLPAMKKAIRLYELEDLPYLTATENKPESEILPPAYAAYAKSNIGDYLTAANLNQTPEGQFKVLRSAVIWMANDILRSPEARAFAGNNQAFIELKELDDRMKIICPENATFQDLNHAKQELLNISKKIVPESRSKILIPNHTLSVEAPTPQPPPGTPTFSREQIEAIAKGLQSDIVTTRFNTVKVLASTHSPYADVYLVIGLTDSNLIVRDIAFDALKDRKEWSEEFMNLLVYSSKYNSDCSRFLTLLLIKIPGHQSTKALINLLNSSDIVVRKSAFNELQRRSILEEHVDDLEPL